MNKTIKEICQEYADIIIQATGFESVQKVFDFMVNELYQHRQEELDTIIAEMEETYEL